MHCIMQYATNNLPFASTLYRWTSFYCPYITSKTDVKSFYQSTPIRKSGRQAMKIVTAVAEMSWPFHYSCKFVCLLRLHHVCFDFIQKYIDMKYTHICIYIYSIYIYIYMYIYMYIVQCTYHIIIYILYILH